MSVIFEVPGKTFLAGEYLALHGGPALVFLSQPSFKTFADAGTGQLQGIHAQSPAGQFVAQHSEFFAQYDIRFEDPYQGLGGLGASTAQFLGVYSLWLYRQSEHQDMESLFDYKHLLKAYQDVAWSGEGIPPSGADLVGQLKGSFTIFDKSQGLISVSSWPFPDLQFALIRTGNKVATHEHLKKLGDFDSSGLAKGFEQIRGAFNSQDSAQFVAGIRTYAEELQRLGFVCEQTQSLLSEISQVPGVTAAKGCGALGADIVLVICQRGSLSEVESFCQRKNLHLVSTEKKSASGLQIRAKENL